MDGTVRLWGPKFGDFRAFLPGPVSGVRYLLFNQDTTVLAAIGSDGMPAIPGVVPLSVARNGSQLLGLENTQVRA